MSDKLNQVGKTIGRSKKQGEFLLTRVNQQFPLVERSKDVFDGAFPFLMEFLTEIEKNNISLDLYFTPHYNFTSICETFVVPDGGADCIECPDRWDCFDDRTSIEWNYPLFDWSNRYSAWFKEHTWDGPGETDTTTEITTFNNSETAFELITAWYEDNAGFGNPYWRSMSFVSWTVPPTATHMRILQPNGVFILGSTWEIWEGNWGVGPPTGVDLTDWVPTTPGVNILAQGDVADLIPMGSNRYETTPGGGFDTGWMPVSTGQLFITGTPTVGIPSFEASQFAFEMGVGSSILVTWAIDSIGTSLGYTRQTWAGYWATPTPFDLETSRTTRLGVEGSAFFESYPTGGTTRLHSETSAGAASKPWQTNTFVMTTRFKVNRIASDDFVTIELYSNSTDIQLWLNIAPSGGYVQIFHGNNAAFSWVADTWYRAELSVSPNNAEARVWIDGATRPSSATSTWSSTGLWDPTNTKFFIGSQTSDSIASGTLHRLEFDWINFTPTFEECVPGADGTITLLYPYIAGSTVVKFNGTLLIRGTDYEETDPALGIITLSDNYLTGETADSIIVCYTIDTLLFPTVDLASLFYPADVKVWLNNTDITYWVFGTETLSPNDITNTWRNIDISNYIKGSGRHKLKLTTTSAGKAEARVTIR